MRNEKEQNCLALKSLDHSFIEAQKTSALSFSMMPPEDYLFCNNLA
jgi:hypothetical protein